MRAIIGILTLSFSAALGCAPLVLPALGQPGVKGSGTVKEETREVADFTAVEIGSTFHAEVSVGPKAPIRISADDNLLPLVKTEVKDGKLSVGFKDNVSVNAKSPLKVWITAPKLEYVGAGGASHVTAKVAASETFDANASGASHLTISGLDAGELRAEASGASQLSLSGKAKTTKAQISGASQIDSGELASASVRADLSGASSGTMQASESVKADLSGASTLNVAGNPKQKAVETSGASHVSFR